DQPVIRPFDTGFRNVSHFDVDLVAFLKLLVPDVFQVVKRPPALIRFPVLARQIAGIARRPEPVAYQVAGIVASAAGDFSLLVWASVWLDMARHPKPTLSDLVNLVSHLLGEELELLADVGQNFRDLGRAA